METSCKPRPLHLHHLRHPQPTFAVQHRATSLLACALGDYVCCVDTPRYTITTIQALPLPFDNSRLRSQWLRRCGVLSVETAESRTQQTSGRSALRICFLGCPTRRITPIGKRVRSEVGRT